MEEFKATRARSVYDHTTDDKVSKAGVQLDTGRKWAVTKTVEETESRLRHKDTVGTVTVERQVNKTKENLYKMRSERRKKNIG